MRIIKSYILLLLVYSLSILSLRRAHKLAYFFSRRFSQSQSSIYRITQQNIRWCFPHLSTDEQATMVQASLLETLKLLLETPQLLLGRLDKNLARIISVDGKQVLDQAISQQKGVILLMPHLGNWELVGHYMSAYYSFTAMYKPFLYPVVCRLIKHYRIKIGTRLVPTTTQGIKQLYSALKQHEIIGILPDQNVTPSGGVFVPFFSLATHTSSLISRLVKRTDAVVITAYAQRLDDSQGFKLIFAAADPQISGDTEQATTAVSANIEACVRQNLAQYQWEYKRFKHKPDGSERSY